MGAMGILQVGILRVGEVCLVACLEAMEVEAEVNINREDMCLRLSRSTMVRRLLVLMDSRAMERTVMVSKDMEAMEATMGTIVVMGAMGIMVATGTMAAATDIMGMVVGGNMHT
jgi:hypothetical protein